MLSTLQCSISHQALLELDLVYAGLVWVNPLRLKMVVAAALLRPPSPLSRITDSLQQTRQLCLCSQLLLLAIAPDGANFHHQKKVWVSRLLLLLRAYKNAGLKHEIHVCESKDDLEACGLQLNTDARIMCVLKHFLTIRPFKQSSDTT